MSCSGELGRAGSLILVLGMLAGAAPGDIELDTGPVLAGLPAYQLILTGPIVGTLLPFDIPCIEHVS